MARLHKSHGLSEHRIAQYRESCIYPGCLKSRRPALMTFDLHAIRELVLATATAKIKSISGTVVTVFVSRGSHFLRSRPPQTDELPVEHDPSGTPTQSEARTSSRTPIFLQCFTGRSTLLLGDSVKSRRERMNIVAEVCTNVAIIRKKGAGLRSSANTGSISSLLVGALFTSRR